MDGKAKIGRLGRPALTEHHQLKLFQRRAGHLAAKALQRFQQQIRALAGIGAPAHGAEQHQRTLGWQAKQRTGLGLIAGGPRDQVDRIGDHRDLPDAHQGAAAGAIGQLVA